MFPSSIYVGITIFILMTVAQLVFRLFSDTTMNHWLSIGLAAISGYFAGVLYQTVVYYRYRSVIQELAKSKS